MSEKPKRRRMRGEILSAARRLFPYITPHAVGVFFLFLVTLTYAGSDAARAWLLKPLFNHILLRGSVTSETIEDARYAALADPKLVEEAKGRAHAEPVDPSVLDDDDLRLAPVIPRNASPELRNDPCAKLLDATRTMMKAAADRGKDRPLDEKGKEKLLKAIQLQREGQKITSPDIVKAPNFEKYVAAALSLDARRRATDAMFGTLWDELLWIFCAAIGIAFVLATFHFLMFYLSRALVTRMVIDIQNKLADHLLTLSIRYFNDERRGELFSRLTNDLQNTQAVLNLLLSDVLIQPVRILVLAGFAAYVSWHLSLSLGFLALAVVIPVRVWGKKIRRSARERQASVANVLEAMQQMFAGIRIVKAFQREKYEMKRFRERTKEYLDTSLRVVRDRTASKSWMELVNDLTIPLVLLAGGWLVIRHTFGIDAGRFASFMACVVLMYMPAKVLATSYNTLQDALPSVDRVFEILDSRAEIQDAPDATVLGPLKEAIRFEDVTFGYLPEVDVLRNVSFTARAGEVTAIVGPTTAGKSTLVDLIARFYDPVRGRVTVDGTDLKKVTLASLLEKIAVVTQDPFLFNDSVKENIRYGRLEATDLEIEAAAKAAKIHDDIVAMPQGYDTNVGERGAKLSGGQRQRVTIARAILKNPEILILDEATSSLDATTERRVQEALEELEHGRTTFVIAHRLSTVQHAHKILVLYEGRLVEEGSHDDLVKKGGLYASLVKDLAMGNGSAEAEGATNGGSKPAGTNGVAVPAPPVARLAGEEAVASPEKPA